MASFTAHHLLRCCHVLLRLNGAKKKEKKKSNHHLPSAKKDSDVQKLLVFIDSEKKCSRHFWIESVREVFKVHHVFMVFLNVISTGIYCCKCYIT